MGALNPISFFVDEHLPVRQARTIFEERGHTVTPVQIGFRDQAILAAAQQANAIIVTADTWFLRELFRYPVDHPRCYRNGGVIQVPGEWPAARLRLERYVSVIEALAEMRRAQPDRRVAVDLSQREIRIWEP